MILTLVKIWAVSSFESRYPTSAHTENSNAKQQILRRQEMRPPLAEIVQNCNNVCNLPVQLLDNGKANEGDYGVHKPRKLVSA